MELDENKYWSPDPPKKSGFFFFYGRAFGASEKLTVIEVIPLTSGTCMYIYGGNFVQPSVFEGYFCRCYMPTLPPGFNK